MKRITHNINVVDISPVISPKALINELPLSEKACKTVFQARKEFQDILRNKDSRNIVIVGPCSIHDPHSALEYAHKLCDLRDKLKDQFLILMRVYFEKPRTSLGWKGFINDPHLDGSCDISTGYHLAREILLKINNLGLPTATEMLDPITPQYISDLVSWASIGARTIESQTHREMASGLSMPTGFKNNTNGDLTIAINAMKSAQHPHNFMGIDLNGQVSIVKTSGNPWGHLILRGGSQGPNYSAQKIQQATDQLIHEGLNPKIIVDCSHANSGHNHLKQAEVFTNVIAQKNPSVMGVMLESHLFEGNQKIPSDLKQLRYGVSITDKCLDWETTRSTLITGAKRESQPKLC